MIFTTSVLMIIANLVSGVEASAVFSSKEDLNAALCTYCAADNTDKLEKKYGPIKKWDVSAITDMSQLFYCGYVKSVRTYPDCNPPISNWDVSGVVDFSSMFSEAANFNQDLSGWDVGSGNSFHSMFYGAITFNQDLSKWDVGSGVYFSNMFYGVANFNQDMSKWDVGSGIEFNYMFYGAANFNQDLSGWNVGSGRNFISMFQGAENFDQDLSKWDVGNGVAFENMFRGVIKFKQDMSKWVVGNDYNHVAFFASLVGIGHPKDDKWKQLNNFIFNVEKKDRKKYARYQKALNKCEKKLSALSTKTCPTASPVSRG